MVKKEDINTFIEQIPPAPKILKQTISFLNIGDLQKAASIAESDLALKSYLKSIVNKPIYGFKNEVNDIGQIFGILGVSQSQQTVYNYMINLLSPKKWILFKLNENSFHELQASLSVKWTIILDYLKIKDNNISSSISLLPSSIIIAEALFNKHVDDVNLLRTAKALDYNTILYRISKLNLFDICEEIAKKWEMDDSISEIIHSASGVNESSTKDINKLAKWMHLLLFYELSQPIFVEAGLNDFIDFQIDYVNDIYDDFATLMDIS